MRIGINLLPLKIGVSGGIETYTINLVRQLTQSNPSTEYVGFTTAENDGAIEQQIPGLQRVRLTIRSRPHVRRALVEQIYLPMLASKLRLDVLHSPFYTWPVAAGVAGVVTICDMLYRVHPRLVGPARKIFWRLLVPISTERCRKVLTISESSRRDIIRYLRVAPSKVVVTPLAVDRSLTEPRPTADEIDRACSTWGIRRPYVLSVGGFGRHKNTVGALNAFCLLQRRHDRGSIQFVVTGNDYGCRRDIERSVSRLGLEEGVRLLGRVPQQTLSALYAGAHGYISLSYFEGFGLTALEAMAHGLPVVVSNRGALPEIVGQAGIVVEPDDPNAAAAALAEVTMNRSTWTRMSARSRERAAMFSWQRTAAITMDVYEAAATRR